MTAASASTSAANLEFNSNVFKGFMAGGLAGVISKTTVAPMDRVKLILQLQGSSTLTTVALPASDLPSTSATAATVVQRTVVGRHQQQQQYKGIIDCFRRVCAEQGVISLWRGNAATVVRCFPHNALNLAFRDYFRLLLVSDVNRKLQPWRFAFGNLVAGGAGAAATLCFLYPLDFARTRLAVDGLAAAGGQRQFNGLWHCLRETCARERGIHGLYRGFFASLHFTVVSRAVFFGIFDTARAALAEDHLHRQLTFTMNWALAQVSIIVSSIACYPMDTVRRRLMMESGNQIKEYRNFVDCFAKILRKEGAASFYKGALSNSLRCTSGALILAVYYEVIKYL